VRVLALAIADGIGELWRAATDGSQPDPAP
jgi:hypothetical protein